MLATCGEKLRRMNSVAYRGKAVALRRLGSYVEPTGGGGSHRSTSLRGATRTRARRARPPRLKSRGLPPILKPSPGFGGHLPHGSSPADVDPFGLHFGTLVEGDLQHAVAQFCLDRIGVDGVG